jgi:cysteine-rich repeat protein
MRAYLNIGAAALLTIACNRPESDLFGSDGAGSSSSQSGSASSGGSASPATGGMEATGADGHEAAQGGSPSEPATGGSTTAANPASDGGAGEPSPPQTPSGGEGAGGEPSLPPEPVCGNGVIEAGEQCDDGGRSGQDGCAECQVVCSHYGSGTLESEDHHCYNGYDEADFAGAREACEERGAHLATISSAAENKLVQKLVNSSKLLGGFEDVGLMMKGKGEYAWVTGEPFTFSNWAQGEPDQKDTRCQGYSSHCYEHCLGMNGQGLWEDHRCDLEDGYVCEWDPPSAK